MWFFNNYINNRRLIVPFSNVERNVVPGYQKLYWSKVVMDLCRSISVNHFLNVKICQTVLFLFFSTLSSNAEGFLCIPYKLCWCVLRNWLCDS
jgi:hypothetical protein